MCTVGARVAGHAFLLLHNDLVDAASRFSNARSRCDRSRPLIKSLFKAILLEYPLSSSFCDGGDHMSSAGSDDSGSLKIHPRRRSGYPAPGYPSHPHRSRSRRLYGRAGHMAMCKYAAWTPGSCQMAAGGGVAGTVVSGNKDRVSGDPNFGVHVVCVCLRQGVWMGERVIGSDGLEIDRLRCRARREQSRTPHTYPGAIHFTVLP